MESILFQCAFGAGDQDAWDDRQSSRQTETDRRANRQMGGWMTKERKNRTPVIRQDGVSILSLSPFSVCSIISS